MNKFLIVIITLLLSFLLLSCKTMDQALSKSGLATDIFNSGIVKKSVELAKMDDTKGMTKLLVDAKIDSYKKDPRRLLRDMKAVKKLYDDLMALLQGNVKKKWGDREVKVASKKRYVKYTQDYKNRAIVDFDSGKITVETIDDQHKLQLKNAIVNLLLTPEDPRAVDLFSDKKVNMHSEKDPYLYDLVLNRAKQPIADLASATAYANYLLKHNSGKRKVKVKGKKRKKLCFILNSACKNTSPILRH